MFNPLEIISNTLNGIISPITGIVSRNQEKDLKELEGNQAKELLRDTSIAQENIEVLKGDAAYDLEALKQKEKSPVDDWLTIVIVFPFVLNFIPFIQPYISLGWKHLADSPLWYQGVFIAVYVSVFGLRGWFRRNPLGK